MAAEPLPKTASQSAKESGPFWCNRTRSYASSSSVPRSSVSWARIAAAGTLIVGGGLLLGGKRKSGLVAATAGASLALLDQKETVLALWNQLPGCIDHAQQVLGQVQESLDEIAVQREKIGKLLQH